MGGGQGTLTCVGGSLAKGSGRADSTTEWAPGARLGPVGLVWSGSAAALPA